MRGHGHSEELGRPEHINIHMLSDHLLRSYFTILSYLCVSSLFYTFKYNGCFFVYTFVFHRMCSPYNEAVTYYFVTTLHASLDLHGMDNDAIVCK